MSMKKKRKPTSESSLRLPKNGNCNTIDPTIHTSNHHEENLAIILNDPLDEDIMDETPPDQLKTNTIDQRKKFLLLWLV